MQNMQKYIQNIVKKFALYYFGTRIPQYIVHWLIRFHATILDKYLSGDLSLENKIFISISSRQPTRPDVPTWIRTEDEYRHYRVRIAK